LRDLKLITIVQLKKARLVVMVEPAKNTTSERKTARENSLTEREVITVKYQTEGMDRATKKRARSQRKR
jgi:hypothetical protein